MNYYNEWDKYAAAWLRNLIAAGHLPAGEVDERSITDVSPGDLAGFTQCHFFAGIGGWSLAARLAGWPEDRELWTGSPPCQPFSVAGKQRGQDDDRHLWPHYFRLIAARRPAVLMGEQVAAAVGKDWLDGVHADLEGIGYSCGAAVVPACAVNAPHRRDRLWFVADASGWTGRQVDPNARGRENGSGAREVPGFGSAGDVAVANASGGRCAGSFDRQGEQSRGAEAVGAGEGDVAKPRSTGHDGTQQHAPEPCSDWQDDRLSIGSGSELRGSGDVADTCSERRQQIACGAHGNEGADEGRPAQLHHVAASNGKSQWSGAGWIIGHDGKARRVEPSICLLAHGVPARVGKLRAYGNAIVPQVAAEVIGAYLECRP